MRAYLLLALDAEGKPCGVEVKDQVARHAAEVMKRVSDLFGMLAREDKDTVAQNLGWPSAEELSKFLWEYRSTSH